jgi:hypothetical protein
MWLPLLDASDPLEGAVFAERFAQAHPVLNALLAVGAFLLIAGLLVFAKPVGRLLGWINLKAMQALGLADRDREPDKDD